MTEKLMKFLAEGKLLVTILQALFSFILALSGVLPADTYATIVIATSVAFITGNVFDSKLGVSQTDWGYEYLVKDEGLKMNKNNKEGVPSRASKELEEIWEILSEESEKEEFDFEVDLLLNPSGKTQPVFYDWR
jgi:hypothetical protein